MSRCRSFTLAITALLLAASQVSAQSWLPPAGVPSSTSAPPSQVISANPFGLLIELFNSEYEIRGSDHVTFGAGASTAMVTTYQAVERRERYINGDAFVRYYPGGQAFTGRSFGVKAGFTRIPSQGSYFGIGFDANQNWLLNEHFFFGSGFGLKHLFGTDEKAFDLKYIPTLRLNVGVAF